MADPGTGEGQGSRGGRLLDRVIPPKENYTPEQRQVYDAAREALEPFEDSYHQEAAAFQKRPLPTGVASKWFGNEYTLQIKTGSGKPVDSKVTIGSLGNNPIMRKLQIGPNKVIFGKDGRIQEIVLVGSALPRVTELRESLLGPQAQAVNGMWSNDQVRLSVKSPTEMYLKVVSPGGDNRFKPIFVVKKDGTLKEKEEGGYATTTLKETRIVKNPHFPDILKDAMEAIDPSSN